MISRERIEQLRHARVKWQDVDDLIAAFDEREELLAECVTQLRRHDAHHHITSVPLRNKMIVLLRGGRFEVKS